MRAFDVSINTATKKLNFHKNSVAPGIRTLNNVTIPPRSIKAIQAKVNTVGVVATKPFNFNSSLLVANSISNVNNNVTDVLICNPTVNSIKITEDTQIGTYEEIECTDIEESMLEKYSHNDSQSSCLIKTIDNTNTKINVSDELTPEQLQELMCVINMNPRAFFIDGEIGLTDLAQHKIDLLDEAKPHAEPLRRRPYTDQEECRRQVKEHLEKGFIEDSDTPWASAYVLAKKKSGEKRLCIDFRKLNDQTKKVVPLPNIEDCLETLSGKQYSSQLDMASGFWQIPMEEKSK